MSIEKGVLYVVATPIGNRQDISPRAVEVLSSVDLIAVEDTRHSRPLLKYLGVSTPLMALHEHNERAVMDRLLGQLEAGGSLALISDAGTPLISDPGFPFVRACRERGVRVSPIPGPSAAISALCVAGLPTDRFLFEGFPARTESARRDQFSRVKDEVVTLIYYESSHRIEKTLKDMVAVFGAQRQGVVARELTKLHETVLTGSLAELHQAVEEDANQRKGEFVVLVAGTHRDASELDPESERILRLLLAELPTKQASALAAQITGKKKNRLYQQALAWQEG